MKRLLSLLVVLGVMLFASAALADSTLSDVLRNQAASELAIDPAGVELMLQDTPGLTGPPQEYTFRFGSVPRGRTVVRAVRTGGRERSFMIDVRIWDTVLVVARTVERGEALTMDAFARARRDITHVSPWSAEQLDRMRARRRLIPGTILAGDAVEPQPLIHRGRPVTLKAVSGTIQVTRQGVALSDAREGETVRVRIDRRTVLSATAVGPQLVVLEL